MATAFERITGHRRQCDWLRQLIAAGKADGTYLFSGPENTGKETVAKAMAKALLCENAQGAGCLQCKSCSDVESLTHPDLTVLSPQGASQTIGKDEIDRLQHSAQRTSFYGGWKVAIIRDAHYLHAQVAPALLKILEEPPAQSVFIMISHRKDQMLATLRSRCRILEFSLLSDDLMRKMLAAEFQGDAASLEVILKLSGGRLGLALEMAHGDALSRRDTILALLEKLEMRSFSSVLATVEGLMSMAKTTKEERTDVPDVKRREERGMLLGLETLLRDVWLAGKSGTSFLMHLDKTAELTKLAQRWSSVRLENALGMAEAMQKDLEFNVPLKLMLEKFFLTLGAEGKA